MTKSVTSGLSAHLNQEATSLASVWKLTRKDGEVFRFTDHDEDIVLAGETYVSSVGYDKTAVQSTAGLSVDNLDVRGFLQDDAITELDLRGGKFDFAEVTIAVVNHADPSQGAVDMRRGWLGEVTLTDEGEFQAELRGLTQVFKQAIGELYTPSCRADLGDGRCKVPIDPHQPERGERLQAAPDSGRTQEGRVQYITLGRTRVSGTNLAFAAGDLSGWTTTAGSPAVLDSDIVTSAFRDGYYVQGADEAGAGYTIEQVIDLSTQLDTDKVDNGELVLDYDSRWTNTDLNADDEASVLVEFRDSGGAVLGTAVDRSGLKEASDWQQVSALGVPIPANTRQLRVELKGALSDTEGSATCGAAHDAVAALVRRADEQADSWEFREDRVFRVVSGGVTDPQFPPTLDTTVGNQSTDGEVLVEAEEAWKRFATVDSVTDNRTFQISVNETRAVDGWFRFGAVRFETGPNAGLVQEVDSWTQSSGEVVLFLAMPFDVSAGDELSIYPGCGKLLAQFCRDKFSNTVNFRGEPFVPGQDALLRVPNARGGG